VANGVQVKVDWVDSEKVELDGAEALLGGAHGVLIPGGFGDRGVEGMVLAAQYARERSVPFLGICLGMQCAVIEFARSVAGLAGADSSEFEAATASVIDPLPISRIDQKAARAARRLRVRAGGGTAAYGAATVAGVIATGTSSTTSIAIVSGEGSA
jgi:CTP synthase